MAVLTVAPYITLSGVLKQLPDWMSFPDAMPWPNAVGHTVLLFGLMGLHAWCYSLWQPAAPNRMLINEFVTRTWFVLFGLVLVGAQTEYGAIYLILAAPWGVASWCTHYLLLRRQERYDAATNTAVLGLFLLGLVLMALLCFRLEASDAAGTF